MSYRIILGDCREAMATLDAESIDAVVTDPPYGIRFMGKAWDGADIERRALQNMRKAGPRPDGGTAYSPSMAAGSYDQSPSAHRAFQDWTHEWATEALRVAKPGSRLLAFGGPRTFHRLTCGIQDAGWEIEDCLSWLYGSGFPKHKSKLKPAWEPVVMARKPASRATPLNIEACRIEGGRRFNPPASNDGTSPASVAPVNVTGYMGRVVDGRWPANVVLDEEAANEIDEQGGTLHSGAAHVLRRGGTTGKGMGYGSSSAGNVLNATYGDAGGASRFYYTAKAARSEREAGLRSLPLQTPESLQGGGESASDPVSQRFTKRARNSHPTVKPLDLMQWLVRLVTPPGGLVLDPFCGSGTTGCAALMEGMSFIGIEQDPEYAEIARRRLAHWGEQVAMPIIAEGA